MVAEVLPRTIYTNLSLYAKRYICKRFKYNTNIGFLNTRDSWIAFIRVLIKSALIVTAETAENSLWFLVLIKNRCYSLPPMIWSLLIPPSVSSNLQWKYCVYNSWDLFNICISVQLKVLFSYPRQPLKVVRSLNCFSISLSLNFQTTCKLMTREWRVDSNY